MTAIGDRSRQTRAVRIFGQLGNQMFQFAFGRAITPPGAPVAIESSSGDIEVLRSAVRDGAIRLLNNREAFVLRRAPMVPRREQIQTLFDIQRSVVVRRFFDRHTHFDPNWGQFDPTLAAPPPPALYQGYFQREEYFLDVADRVVGDFRPPSVRAIETFQRAATPSQGRPIVAVHLRAGADYAGLGWNPHFEWFRRAAELMTDRVGKVGFIIASDIPLAAEAVAAALSDLGPCEPILESNPYDTMRALSLADHAINSPSSFSWWASWLGDHRVGFDDSRVVISPTFWLVDGMQPAPLRWTALDLSP